MLGWQESKREYITAKPEDRLKPDWSFMLYCLIRLKFEHYIFEFSFKALRLVVFVFF